VLGNDDVRRDCAEKLAKVAGFVQRRIADSIKIHHVPRVRFQFDASIEESMKLERLFNEIERERRQTE
jgi:ribosome-binding factor A